MVFATIINDTSFKKNTPSFTDFVSENKSKHLEIKESELRAIYDILIAKKEISLNDKISPACLSHIENALKLIPRINSQGLLIWLNAEIGWIYYSYNYYEKAFEYFLATSNIIESSSYINEQLIQDAYIYLSYFNFTIKDYAKSISYSNKALTIIDKSTSNYRSLLNNIGNNYYELNNIDEAKNYFESALNYSNKANDTLRYAKVLGDLAKIHIKTKDYKKAEEMLLKDIFLSKQINAERNTMFAQLRLATLYMDKKEFQKAKNLLIEGRNYAKTKEYLQHFDYDYSKHLIEISYREGDQFKELYYRRYLDSLEVILNQKDGNHVVDKINWKSEKESILKRIENDELILKKTNLLKWSFVFITVLLLLLLILLIKFSRRKIKMTKVEFEHALLEHEIAMISSEKILEENNHSLKSYQTFLKAKQQQIENLKVQLGNLELLNNDQINAQKEGIESLLNSHLMTPEKWSLFKKTFRNEQTQYYNSLLIRYPDLSESNLRIILLQKLGLNNAEIAKILGITVDAVKKSKQRLIKKYNIKFEELLSSN